MDDIKRMKLELIWGPGTCANCNGKGKVDQKVVDKVPFDAAYLVNNLSEEERELVRQGDWITTMRAKGFVKRADDFIDDICYLYTEKNLTILQIAKFFLKNAPEASEEEKQKLIEYIEKVIDVKFTQEV